MRNRDGVGSISNTFYTLIWLNQAAKSLDPVGWAAIPSAIPLAGAGDVPPPGTDVVPERIQLPQTTSPRIPGRTPTSPAVQSTSPK